MALFGLFGGKKKNNDTPKGDFFLDFEEAQTFGNTEYMKKPVTIKRTFPTVRGEKGATLVTQVSSENMRKVDPNQAASRNTESNSSESFSAPQPTLSSSKPNLKVDSNMDMFRNMAKKINR
ncbi:hypothetical protein NIES970_01420 [[Synechococcus] sp. NIES-970]|uniref:hypothetical protein n=1 Tax=Picosynechococcus sp. NKBG15041c TaxID=1407650 RepID=UPI00041F935E|nr:hypothetical protein [Picosynechococcus sp. NKBG15041c]BAW95240.1 hypothetical protein NIES970_01420 [[Synechococcus] sp. NIES-970]